MGKMQGALKRKATRVLLGSPFSSSCSPTSESVERIIVDHLGKLARALEEGNADLKKEVTFGLNSVCRGVERGTLCAALVAHPVHPQILSQQLSRLCEQRGLPLLAHSQLAGVVATKFKLSSLMTLGLSKSAESPSSLLHPLFEDIRRHASGQVAAPEELARARVTFRVPKSVPPAGAPSQQRVHHFLPLARNPVFPDPDHPRELDGLKMRVAWSASDLEAASNGSPADMGSGVRRRYLLDARTEIVTSSGKVKKAKRERSGQ